MSRYNELQKLYKDENISFQNYIDYCIDYIVVIRNMLANNWDIPEGHIKLFPFIGKEKMDLSRQYTFNEIIRVWEDGFINFNIGILFLHKFFLKHVKLKKVRKKFIIILQCQIKAYSYIII